MFHRTKKERVLFILLLCTDASQAPRSWSRMVIEEEDTQTHGHLKHWLTWTPCLVSFSQGGKSTVLTSMETLLFTSLPDMVRSCWSALCSLMELTRPGEFLLTWDWLMLFILVHRRNKLNSKLNLNSLHLCLFLISVHFNLISVCI